MRDIDKNAISEIEALLEEGKVAEVQQFLATISDISSIVQQFLQYKVKNSIGTSSESIQELNQLITQNMQQEHDPEIESELFTEKGILLSRMQKYDEAIQVLEQGIITLKTLESTRKENKKRYAKLYYYEGVAYQYKGDLSHALELCTKSFVLQEQLDSPRGIAKALNSIGVIYLYQGQLDHALERLLKSLDLLEKVSATDAEKVRPINNIGLIHLYKGELDNALQYFQRAHELSKKHGNKAYIAACLGNIGEVYSQKNQTPQAIEALEQTLALFIEIKNNLNISETLFRLVTIALNSSQLELATKFFNQLKDLSQIDKNDIINHRVRVAEALLLKNSARMRKRAKAEEMLEQVVSERSIDQELTSIALLNLCELLFDELRSSGELEVLNEIKTYVNRLQDIAKAQTSHSLFVEISILTAKLALIDLNITEARRILTHAQFLAQEKGLDRVSAKISMEHDNLLNELARWEEYSENNATLSERTELARAGDIVGDLLKKKTLDIDSLPDEKPVLLLIMSIHGLSLFSNSFTRLAINDEQLISGMFSAINVFSGEVFSSSIDRLKIGEFNVVLKSLNKEHLVVYVFKGQSYKALQKLERFITEMMTIENINSTVVFNSNELPHLTQKIVKDLNLISKKIFNT